MSKLRRQLVTELEKIPHLEGRPSKVAAGSALFYKNKEIAHFHSNNEIDVRLTKKIIKQEKLIQPTDSEFHHHRSPNSEWIELKFKKSSDIAKVLRLFKLAIQQYN